MADGRGLASEPLAWSGQSDKASYYRLYVAYVIALFATAVATVALGLVAFEIAGAESGAILGTALSLKMFAYVVAAPLAAALTERMPRKPLLIWLDLIRAGSLVVVPFAGEAATILVLVFVFSLASATFTLVYQTLVPYLLGSEADYTRSLSRSRIASELESTLGPLLAGTLLLVLGVKAVFVAAALAFLVSAKLVAAARLPATRTARASGIWAKVWRGPRLFLATPDLRGLLALDLVVAVATAMVMVNTVVLVESVYRGGLRQVAVAFAVFGFGAILGAVAMPLGLRHAPFRAVMLAGGGLVVLGLGLGAVLQTYTGLLALWAYLGLGTALCLTPASYLIRRTAAP
ncbi:MAG: MFS transporter, partial [Mangrovicoccus sp.]|nr:MFS transporter [Mangrovicoccus sp.]